LSAVLTACPPLRSTLFPYTTLFRSFEVREQSGALVVVGDDTRAGRQRSLDPRLRRQAARGGFAGKEPCSDHDRGIGRIRAARDRDRKSTRLNSSHVKISYAVFCLKK